MRVYVRLSNTIIGAVLVLGLVSQKVLEGLGRASTTTDELV